MTVWALRFFASVLLLIAVIAAVADGTRTMAAERLVVTSAGEQWGKIAPNSFKFAQTYVQRTTHPLVWETGVRPLLAAADLGSCSGGLASCWPTSDGGGGA